MTGDALRRVKRLFDEAVSLSQTERSAFLDRTCGNDATTRAEVERLLQADPAAAEFLEDRDRPDVSELFAAERSDLVPGLRLGRYSLRRRIASGGMGTVWEAEQDRPKRTVALKTIRLGFATEERRQRFRLETEVLGRLRHPGIAQIYEAGTHDDSAGSFPYFAMEFIEGARDIMTFAEEAGLERPARIALFAEVCDAVHHGHQRGIVHRDLKPGNILVDPSGQPKIIDFGLARATPLEHSITTAETAAGALLGTLLYMSPEQLAADPAEVDTRSDVYALGVLLYQLVTGDLPHDTRGLSIQRMIAVLRESEPKRPTGVPTDLVWVIFRALEKDPSQRYPSASELAADVRRFLKHEPVLAGPPSLRYRIVKLVRRQRVLVTTTSLVLLALAAGVAGVMWKAREARTEAAVAVRLNDFFAELLESPTPYQGGRDVPMGDVLDAAAARIAEAFPDRPDVQARLRVSIGKALQQLGRYEEARPHLELAVASALAEFGELHPTTVEALFNYATVLRRTNHLAEAEAGYRKVAGIQARLLGPEHYRTSSTRVSLSTVLLEQGKNEEAAELVGALLDILPTDQEPLPGDSPADVHRVAMSILSNQVNVLRLQGKPEEALLQAEQATAYGEEHLGPDDPDTALAYALYANRLWELGRLEEAEEVYALALDLMRESLGEMDSNLLGLLNNYVQFLLAQGRHAEAEPLAREAYVQASAGRSIHLPRLRSGFVRALLETGGEEEAMQLLRRDLGESDSAEERHQLAEQLARILEHDGNGEEAGRLRTEHGGG